MNFEFVPVKLNSKLFVFFAMLIVIPSATSLAMDNGDPPKYDQNVLSAVKDLYNASESEVIDRLAREDIATNIYQHVRNSNFKSYAGAWIDQRSLQLNVALSDRSEFRLASRLGAVPVLATYSLAELQQLRSEFISDLRSVERVSKANIASWIDYPNNEVVVQVEADILPDAMNHRDNRNYASFPIRVSESDAFPAPSSGSFRGAEGYVNDRTDLECSIGASVVGGFVTAGHCGIVNDDILTPSLGSFGEIQGSTFQLSHPYYLYGEDGAFVSTDYGWTPLGQTEGYSDGILPINPEWSGLLEAPVYATVCRYGQTSGGPNCGQIEEKNYDFGGQTTSLEGFVKASGDICTENGDSGGPYLTPSLQMQGTNFGGINAGGCPGTDADAVIYQPIDTTLSRFSKTMLTSHGSNSPDIVDFSCVPQGGSLLFCSTGYESQGSTTVQWRLNGVLQGSGTARGISCTAGQTETIQVSATVWHWQPIGQCILSWWTTMVSSILEDDLT